MKVLTKTDQNMIVHALAAVTKSGGGSALHTLYLDLCTAWEIETDDELVIEFQEAAAEGLEPKYRRPAHLQIQRPTDKVWLLINSTTGRFISSSFNKYPGVPEFFDAQEQLQKIQESLEALLVAVKEKSS